MPSVAPGSPAFMAGIYMCVCVCVWGGAVFTSLLSLA